MPGGGSDKVLLSVCLSAAALFVSLLPAERCSSPPTPSQGVLDFTLLSKHDLQERMRLVMRDSSRFPHAALRQ